MRSAVNRRRQLGNRRLSPPSKAYFSRSGATQGSDSFLFSFRSVPSSGPRRVHVRVLFLVRGGVYRLQTEPSIQRLPFIKRGLAQRWFCHKGNIPTNRITPRALQRSSQTHCCSQARYQPSRWLSDPYDVARKFGFDLFLDIVAVDARCIATYEWPAGNLKYRLHERNNVLRGKSTCSPAFALCLPFYIPSGVVKRGLTPEPCWTAADWVRAEQGHNLASFLTHSVNCKITTPA